MGEVNSLRFVLEFHLYLTFDKVNEAWNIVEKKRSMQQMSSIVFRVQMLQLYGVHLKPLVQQDPDIYLYCVRLLYPWQGVPVVFLGQKHQHVLCQTFTRYTGPALMLQSWLARRWSVWLRSSLLRRDVWATFADPGGPKSAHREYVDESMGPFMSSPHMKDQYRQHADKWKILL